ncbi:MAG: ankyrin repeat domain-containing protein [Thermodesulfobacteriota bacterium]
MNSKDEIWHHSGLWIAVRCSHLNVAALLLDRGALVDERDSENWTPLMLACQRWQVKLVRMLLERGANPNATDHRGSTPWIAGQKK